MAVYYRGAWGTVCEDGWDEKDGLVVCRELGYPGVTMVTKHRFFGLKGTINVERLGCYGNETKLSECSYKTTTEMSDCRTERRKEAGVICEAGNHTDIRGSILQLLERFYPIVIWINWLNDTLSEKCCLKKMFDRCTDLL